MKDDKDIWIDVLDYEGLYQVNFIGQVKSLARKVSHPTVGSITVKERILKKYISPKTGYCYVVLCKDGKTVNKTIHSILMCSAYRLKYNADNKYIEIHHVDRNKQNNNFDNLCFVTKRYNQNEKHIGKTLVCKYPNVRKQGNGFISRISIKGVRYVIGKFNTEDEAFLAYVDKVNELGETTYHQEELI